MAGVTSNPKFNVQLLPAAVVDAYAGRRDLIVGQIGAGGSAVTGELALDIHLKTIPEIRGLFGDGSDLTHKVLMFLAANGAYSSLDVIAVAPNGAADAAEATITAS